MLSTDESLFYVKYRLRIKEPEKEMQRNRLEFLNKLICAFYAAMPFQIQAIYRTQRTIYSADQTIDVKQRRWHVLYFKSILIHDSSVSRL